MDAKTTLLILIPSFLSFALSALSLILSYLRERKRREDLIWEAAKELLLHGVGGIEPANPSIHDAIKRLALLRLALDKVAKAKPNENYDNLLEYLKGQSMRL